MAIWILSIFQHKIWMPFFLHLFHINLRHLSSFLSLLVKQVLVKWYVGKFNARYKGVCRNLWVFLRSAEDTCCLLCACLEHIRECEPFLWKLVVDRSAFFPWIWCRLLLSSCFSRKVNYFCFSDFYTKVIIKRNEK